MSYYILYGPRVHDSESERNKNSLDNPKHYEFSVYE